MREARLRSLVFKLTILLIVGIALVSAGVVWLLILNGQAQGGVSGARFVLNVIGGAAA